MQEEGKNCRESAELTVSKRQGLPGFPGGLKTGAQEDEGVSDGHVGRLWIQLCSLYAKAPLQSPSPHPAALDSPC